MYGLINLLASLYIFMAPFFLAHWVGARIWPMVLALFYTLTAIIASALVYTPGIGHGGWLMLTLPFSPILLLYGWLIIKAWIWWTGRKAPVAPSQTHHFGRS